MSAGVPTQACFGCFFFFNDTATTEIYTLSLHDALPICAGWWRSHASPPSVAARSATRLASPSTSRSEEHTSELQSQSNLVCRLLLEKKKHQHDSDRLSPHYRRRSADPSASASRAQICSC